MNCFLFFVLCASSVLAKDSLDDGSPARKYVRDFQKSESAQKSLSDLTAKFSKKSKTQAVAGSVANPLQMLLLMTAFTAAEGVKEQVRINGIQKDPSLKDVQAAAAKSAEAVINGTSTFAGMTAMFGTALATSQAGSMFRKLLGNPEMRSRILRFVGGAAATFAALAAFEYGSDLWDAAISMLPNPEDQEKARKVLSSSSRSSQDEKLFTAVSENMLAILGDEELRGRLWSHLARSKVLTGDFAVALAAMMAITPTAQAIAACVPNPIAKAAMPVGMVSSAMVIGFGVGYVPKEWTDEITDVVKSVRRRSAVDRAQVDLQSIGQLASQHKADRQGLRAQGLRRQITDHLKHLKVTHEELLTVHAEQMYRSNTRLSALQTEVEAARQVGNQEFLGQTLPLMAQYRAEFAQQHRGLLRDLKRQVEFLDKVAKGSSDVNLKAQIEKEIKDTQGLRAAVDQYQRQILSTASWNSNNGPRAVVGTMTDEENQSLLDALYLWGVKPASFVKTIRATSTEELSIPD